MWARRGRSPRRSSLLRRTCGGAHWHKVRAGGEAETLPISQHWARGWPHSPCQSPLTSSTLSSWLLLGGDSLILQAARA